MKKIKNVKKTRFKFIFFEHFQKFTRYLFLNFQLSLLSTPYSKFVAALKHARLHNILSREFDVVFFFHTVACSALKINKKISSCSPIQFQKIQIFYQIIESDLTKKHFCSQGAPINIEICLCFIIASSRCLSR